MSTRTGPISWNGSNRPRPNRTAISPRNPVRNWPPVNRGARMSVSLPHEAEAHHHPEMSFLRKYIFSTDHKIIGIQFLFSTLIFLLLGGLLALLVRLQLGWPHADHSWLGKLLKWPASYGGHM